MASNAELSDCEYGAPSILPLDPEFEPRTTSQLRTKRTDYNNTVLNQYERLKRIGTGQHGEVYVAVDNTTETLVAIKGMKRKNSREDKMKLLRRSAIQASPHTPITDRLGTTETKILKEIAIMKKCRHAHVVRLLEVIDDRMKHKIYMVMEFLGGGEIKWRNSDHEPILNVDQTRRICRDAILGLEYLHYQGIIHRDIKPANLLWTEDRQQVKISDFGVSHFSMALRMAAAGSGQAALDNPNDPRVDRELSKRAGTPSFLAPEIVYEYKHENLPAYARTDGAFNPYESTNGERSTSTLHIPLARPPATKAIDVWALGITLYCLLFGRVPFYYGGDNAFRTYVLIANSDWGVDETMGFDRMPTHGRNPPPDDHSEAAVIINILDKMLQKDAVDRMTLAEFKSHPWITRDIPNVKEWLHETGPGKNDMVMVTDFETQSAMSSVHYRHGWHQRIKHRISSLLHNVRPHRSSRSVGQAEDDKFCSDSAPHLQGHHVYHDSKGHTSESRRKGKKADLKEKGKGVDPREKGKSREKNRPKTARNESGSTVATTSTRSRRGSEPLLVPEGSELVGHLSRAGSPTSSRAGDEHTFSQKRQANDRPRNRFSVRSLTERWRPHKSPSHGSTPPGASTSTFSSSAESHTHASSYTGPSRARNNVRSYTGRFSPVLFARRASSWGDVGDYEDELSLNSGRDDEPVGRDSIMIGAGGVANEPVYGTSTLARFRTAAVVAYTSPSSSRLPPMLNSSSSLLQSPADPVSQDTGFARQVQTRSQTASPSPLAHMAYGHNGDLERTHDEDSDADSHSFGEIVKGTSYQGGPYSDNHSSGSRHIYGEGDEDDSDEENVPVEVRRRRPSVAVTAASPRPFGGKPL